MTLPLTAPAGLAAISGNAIWFLYFHRFETHKHGLLYLNCFALSVVGGFFLLNNVYKQSASEAATFVGAVAASFLVGAYGSMLIWRAFMNPLNNMPGPWAARLGNLWFSVHVRNSDAYYKLQDLHRKNGKIVRIGSNDLSIIDPKIMEAANGRNSDVKKGWWYDNDAPLTSMHTTRDRALHDKRRKVWAPAFSEKAVRDYETRIEGYTDLLIEKITAYKGEPIDVRLWFNLFSFDAMALLAFGKDYGMLQKGEKHWALDLLDEGMQPLAFFLPGWLFRMLTKIPGAAAGYQKFVKFCVDELSWRVENAKAAEKSGKSDIMSWILRAYEGIERPQKDPMLQADARLIIVAGSDTTAATFTYLFYHLAKNPSAVQKLREELKPLMNGDWSDRDINQAQYLNGCINESLRMHPPVPSGVQRQMPPQGMEVDGRHVPGGTIFYMPQYVIGRGESCFEHAGYGLYETLRVRN